MNDELQYPPFDDEGKVACQICGETFQVISPRHLAKHKIQYADYRKRYPEAPLSCDQFIAKSKYGKNSELFVDDADINDDVMGEEEVVSEDPELEELELEVALQSVVDECRDHVQVQKMRVLDHLRLHFANIERDYTIRAKSSISKKDLFQYITDFCDPVLKIVIQFPQTFWHNEEIYVQPLKNHNLQKEGWKVLEIMGKAPSAEDIDSVIDSM